jgi:hypothetical protein
MADPEPADGPAAPAQSSSIITGRLPDITAAQIIAVVGAVITAAVAFGAHISKEQQIAILGLAGAVAGILLAADAHLRSRRGHAEAIKHLADRHLEATKLSLDQGQPPPAAPNVGQ